MCVERCSRSAISGYGLYHTDLTDFEGLGLARKIMCVVSGFNRSAMSFHRTFVCFTQKEKGWRDYCLSHTDWTDLDGLGWRDAYILNHRFSLIITCIVERSLSLLHLPDCHGFLGPQAVLINTDLLARWSEARGQLSAVSY